ncbi:MAG: hypothetical protein U1E83_01075 [Methylotetracoccus sp.]
MAWAPEKTQYFSNRGNVLIAERQRIIDTDENGLVVPSTGFYELGNCPEISLEITEEAEEIQDMQTGLDQVDLYHVKNQKGSGSMKLYSASRRGLELAFRSSSTRLRPKGSKVGANLVLYNKTGERWAKITALPNLTTKYRFGDADPTTNLQEPFASITSTSLVIKDSSGTPKTLVAGTNYVVSNWRLGEVQFTDLTTGGPFVGPLTANFDYGSLQHKITGGIFNVVHGLEMTNISDLVIKDSAGTPVTVNPDFYEVNTEHGSIKFKTSKIAAYNAANYVEPLTVTFTHGASTNFAFLSAPADKEFWLRLEWRDKISGRTGVDEFYRVRVSPANNWQSINAAVGTFDLKFTALADFNKIPDGVLGRVGRRIVND